MAMSGVPSLDSVPNLTTLETSRSTRKSLIRPQPPPLRRTYTPATELPVVSQRKTAGADLYVTSRLSWFTCFAVVTLVTVFLLGTHPLFNDSEMISFFCSNVPPSSSSLLADDEHPSVEFQRSRDYRFGFYDMGQENVDDRCWSRTRHWMYRPPERRLPPSASLTRALHEYGQLHARCTAGKKWKSFDEITKSGRSQDSCQYLMYIEGVEGLRNRFISLVTAFAHALITNRVLLLDSRRNMSGLICEPFQGSSWNLPTTFPFEKVDELHSLDDILDIQQLEKMAAVRLNLRHTQTERDQLFFCADVQEKLRHVAFIGWESNEYYVARLYTMPEFWKKLNPLFDDPSLVFTQLSRILLLPRNAIWARTERLYRAYLQASSRKLVGMQVRSPRLYSFEQKIQDRIMQCLVSYQILPKLSEQTSNFSTATTKVPEQRTAVLVTSLHREYYENLMELYAERGAEDGSLVTVHTMAAPGEENSSHDQAVKAFVDILLLSFSDSLATSGDSTFGYVAQGFGAIIPYIVNTDIDVPESCDIGQSFEPCTHFPFLSSCPARSLNGLNDSSEHGVWINEHLRHCQDRPWGIQLV